jgi:hypothetical protein
MWRKRHLFYATPREYSNGVTKYAKGICRQGKGYSPLKNIQGKQNEYDAKNIIWTNS